MVVEVTAPAHPRLDGPDVCILLQAIFGKTAVSFDYITKKNQRKRVTCSPHRILFANSVYRFRGVDHRDERVKDYNLARVSGCRIVPDVDYADHTRDREWTEPESLCFRLNGDLKTLDTEPLRQTYPLDSDGCLRIETTRALSHYVCQDVLSRTALLPDGTLTTAFRKIDPSTADDPLSF